MTNKNPQISGTEPYVEHNIRQEPMLGSSKQLDPNWDLIEQEIRKHYPKGLTIK